MTRSLTDEELMQAHALRSIQAIAEGKVPPPPPVPGIPKGIITQAIFESMGGLSRAWRRLNRPSQRKHLLGCSSPEALTLSMMWGDGLEWT